MSRMVVGTMYRKIRGHEKLSDSNIVRENMVVTESYANEIIENAKNDPRTLRHFKIDEAKTAEYHEASKKGREELMNKRKIQEAEKSGLAAELIRAASGNTGASNYPKDEAPKSSDKNAEKEKRKKLFKEADELGLTVAKNIKTKDLEERVKNGKDLADEEE